MAYVTGVALIVLCFVGIPLQVAGHPAVASDVGVVHGLLYIVYLVSVFLLSRKIRLEPRQLVIFVLAGIVPVMTFIVERWATRRFIDPALAEPTSTQSGSRPSQGGPGGRVPPVQGSQQSTETVR
jgi:integral membrane protein